MEEKFYSDLYDIIDDRTNKGKALSISDYKSIAFIYNRRFHTDKYVKGVIGVDFADKNQFGAYSLDKRLIKIDQIKIKNNTDLDGLFGYNVEALHTMLHELHHAYQLKRISETSFDDNVSDIELFLLINTYFYIKYIKINKPLVLDEWDIKVITNLGINPKSHTLAEDIKDYINDYYNINPSERMAEIKSLNQIKTMLLKHKCNWSQLDKIDFRIYKELVRGYQKGPKDLCYNSPSIRFFRQLKFYPEINSLQDLIYGYKGELSNYKRLYYGIHADDELVKKLKSSNKINTYKG